MSDFRFRFGEDPPKRERRWSDAERASFRSTTNLAGKPFRDVGREISSLFRMPKTRDPSDLSDDEIAQESIHFGPSDEQIAQESIHFGPLTTAEHFGLEGDIDDIDLEVDEIEQELVEKFGFFLAPLQLAATGVATVAIPAVVRALRSRGKRLEGLQEKLEKIEEKAESADGKKADRLGRRAAKLQARIEKLQEKIEEKGAGGKRGKKNKEDEEFAGFLQGLGKSLGSVGRGIGGAARKVGQGLGDAAQWTGGALQTAGQGIGTGVKNVGQGLGNINLGGGGGGRSKDDSSSAFTAPAATSSLFPAGPTPRKVVVKYGEERFSFGGTRSLDPVSNASRSAMREIEDRWVGSSSVLSVRDDLWRDGPVLLVTTTDGMRPRGFPKKVQGLRVAFLRP